jgi:hypothetical protein
LTRCAPRANPRKKSVDEALARAPTRLRTATQALRQMRAARKAAAVTQPRPVETRDQFAAVSTSTPAPEQKPAHERVVKEAPVVKETPATKEAPPTAQVKSVDPKPAVERAGKDARNASIEPDRIRPTAVPAQPPVKVISRSQEQAAGQGWDCVPSPPSGQIVCHPIGKKPAPAKAATTKLFEISEGPSPQQRPPVEQRQPPEPRRAPEQQNAGAAAWDCQPTPPDGQVLCRPPGGTGQRR